MKMLNCVEIFLMIIYNILQSVFMDQDLIFWLSLRLLGFQCKILFISKVQRYVLGYNSFIHGSLLS